ncbi:hypothetical protein ACFU76_08235 [Streptomyces sp. NPDC057539]|uniref:hypothetical protein n=1 Tax=unclassified Streptomyces TaxID=2593676 RepID=UPI00201F564C|nr:hypothetical protein [Streptomyces sp. 35G-GA-8]MCL7380426.1 hypothetical protein [Streptomyces sp. 35G-GA-8]
MYKRRRLLGTYLGVALATLLPGVSAVADDASWMGVILGASAFLILNQLIYTYPSDIRNAPPVALLIQAAIGIVQDTLIWLLVSWLSSTLDFGIHVDTFLTALLAGVIVRALVLLLLALGPQPAKEVS